MEKTTVNDFTKKRIEEENLKLSNLKWEFLKRKNELKNLEKNINRTKDLICKKNTQYFLEIMKDYPYELNHTNIYEGWTEDTRQDMREIYYEHEEKYFYVLTNKIKKYFFRKRYYTVKLKICSLKKITDRKIKHLSDFEDITEREVWHFLMCDEFENLVTNMIKNLEEECIYTKNMNDDTQEKIDEKKKYLSEINSKLNEKGK